MGDYGRLLDMADEVVHRASAFEIAVRENNDFHHRLKRYQQLKQAVEDTGHALLSYGRQMAKDRDKGKPPEEGA